MLEDALPHLQLRQLRQLVAVAEAGSIRRAAEVLAIAQPALSRSMRALEDQLEVKLMTRGPRGIELTEYGQTLVDYAKIIETNLRFASEEIEDLRGVNGGHVRIGVGPFEGASILHMAINNLLEKRPTADVGIYQGNFDSLMPQLVAGDLDMIIGPGNANGTMPSLKIEVLATLHPVLVARAEHPLASKNEVTLEDLSAAKWVLPYRGTIARAEWENLFIRHGLVPPRAPVEGPPSTLTKLIVKQRDIVSLMPMQLLEPEKTEGTIKILPVGSIDFSVKVQLTTRDFGKLPPACRDMIYEIKKVCSTLEDPA